jgi:hypothetical protein
MALPRATDVEFLGTSGSGGTVLGQSATELIGFYGKAPSAQRAYSSAVHATSALASSTDFGVTQLAAVQEIQKTLIAIGVWATA